MDLVGLRINFGREILIGTKLLAGGHQHGIFHRVDDDLRVDAFLFAQNLNGLKYRCQSGCLFLSAQIVEGLPLELQVCSFDAGQWDVNDAAFGRFDQDLLAFDTAKNTFPILLLFDRLVRYDLCLLSRETR